MRKSIAVPALLITLPLSAITYAEKVIENYKSLEMTEVTIRMTGGHPYGELRPCPECALRLLPFAPAAVVYINGQRTTADSLRDGETLEGTIFIRSTPIDSINEIIAK